MDIIPADLDTIQTLISWMIGIALFFGSVGMYLLGKQEKRIEKLEENSLSRSEHRRITDIITENHIRSFNELSSSVSRVEESAKEARKEVLDELRIIRSEVRSG